MVVVSHEIVEALETTRVFDSALDGSNSPNMNIFFDTSRKSFKENEVGIGLALME